MEINLLPKLKPDSTLADYNEWLNEFSAFVDIVLKEDEIDTKGLKFIKYAVAGSKLSLSFDGHTTYQSALKKIKKEFEIQRKSSTPLKDFYELKWENIDVCFGQYVLKLQSMVNFLDHKPAQEQLIIQHCLEQLRSEFRILLKEKSLSNLIESVSELNKADIIVNSVYASNINRFEKSKQGIICHNCKKVGHYSTSCKAKKWKCNNCHKFGHKEEFCRNYSKNVCGINLSADQLVQSEVASAKL